MVRFMQHPYVDKGALKNDDVESLAKVVSVTKKTVLSLTEKTLSRIWCIYEV